MMLPACNKDEDSTIILMAASEKGTCHIINNFPCYIVKYPGSYTWERIPNDIRGFDYEPGYEYTLRVIKKSMKNPPEDWIDYYQLVKVISKIQKKSENLPPPAPWE